MNYIIHPAPTEWVISPIIRCPISTLYYTRAPAVMQPNVRTLSSNKFMTLNNTEFILLQLGLRVSLISRILKHRFGFKPLRSLIKHSVVLC